MSTPCAQQGARAAGRVMQLDMHSAVSPTMDKAAGTDLVSTSPCARPPHRREICTGEMPARGWKRDLVAPQDCPQEVADLQKRCVASDPNARPSAAELTEVLSRFQREPSGGDAPAAALTDAAFAASAAPPAVLGGSSSQDAVAAGAAPGTLQASSSSKPVGGSAIRAVRLVGNILPSPLLAAMEAGPGGTGKDAGIPQ